VDSVTWTRNTVIVKCGKTLIQTSVLINKQFSLVVLASYAFESVTSVLPRADLRLLRRGPRGCFRSECRICREPMAASVSLHPTINTEQEAGQAASTVCQVFRLTRTGFKLSLLV